ncbi:MAG: MarR family transcriptional regulator [Acidobacteria bacterium]|nr:MarR family transcriptional regulator [Acidobacteriota bacterium]
MAARVTSQIEEEATLAVVRKADQLMQRISDLLKPYGLSPTQYNVLRILRGAGKDGASCKDIGSRLIARDPDVTRLMDRLEKRGILTRDRAREDRRVVAHRLTEEGLALVNELDRPVRELHRKTMRGIDPAKLETLISILEEIRIEA